MGLIDDPPQPDESTSDARRLWDDAPKPKAQSGPGAIRPPAPDEPDEFDLIPVATARPKRTMPAFDDALSPSRAKPVPDRSGRIESARDFPLWSRYQESGPALFRVLFSAGITLLLAWLFADWNTIHVSGWFALIGGISTILMAYPLVVGLERPVRTSPERVVRDFFESLEHHVPLYRRMWLLLTPESRVTRHYTDLAGFREYWKGRIREWQHRGAWPGTPVVMSIGSLTATPDPGEPFVRHLKFTLAVSLRGRRSSGSVATYDISWTAERGRDGQWYLRQAEPPG